MVGLGTEKFCCFLCSACFYARELTDADAHVISFFAALHEERITHVFTNTDGINNPHGLQEDIAHKLLESDLTLQMGLLKDKLATEHMQEDSRAAFGMMNPRSATMNLPVMDGMVDEESSEALMICLTIAGLALLPQIM
jgi:hypothetical protein